MQSQAPITLRNSKPASITSLLFFWDYDTQWGADRSRSQGGPKEWGHLEFENTEELLEIHAEFDMPACFAVVGAASLSGMRPYHDPKQIQMIHSLGHEVASHSMYHDWLPSLSFKELIKNLQESKDALEQCIRHPVTAFVPPYNQPFDYWQKLSFSRSERREALSERIDISRMCIALRETGYKFSRVSYSPLWTRLAEKLSNRRYDSPSDLELIEGVTCLRLNTPGGFSTYVQKQLEAWIPSGKTIVVYGHPHSLYSNNSQNKDNLLQFFKIVKTLRHAGQLVVRLPRDLV